MFDFWIQMCNDRFTISDKALDTEIAVGLFFRFIRGVIYDQGVFNCPWLWVLLFAVRVRITWTATDTLSIIETFIQIYPISGDWLWMTGADK